MKPTIKTSITLSLLGAALLGGGLVQTEAQQDIWTGGGGDLLWSNTNNWSLAKVPAFTNTVIFLTNGTVTSIPGQINNEVSGNITTSFMSDQDRISTNANLIGFNTTLIDPGVTWNIRATNSGGALVSVGLTADPYSLTDTAYYYTITGAGGSLATGNTNTPYTATTIQGVQVTCASGSRPHNAVLDLSGLGSFSTGGSYFWVGINGGNTTNTARPAGQLYLAQTNLIVINGHNYDPQTVANGVGSFRVGESKGGTPLSTCFVQLGQQNTFYLTYLKIGGQACGALPTSGAYMNFETNLINPTLKLRNMDGATRLPFMAIGINTNVNSGNSIPSQGLVDLSGGTVDALVNQLWVGYGCSAGGAFPNCWSRGDLTYTAGTFDITTLNIANEFGNSGAACTGAVTVASSAATLIASNLYLGFCAGSLAPDVATLNINGGTVTVSNLLTQTFASSAFKPQSTVILTNGGTLNLLKPMLADFNDLEYGGTLNYSTNTTLTATAINVWSPNTEFTVGPGLTLSPAGAGIAGILNVGGAVTLNGGGLSLDLGPSSADAVNASGSVTLQNTNALAVNLTGALPVGTYPLISGTSLSGGLGNLSTTVTGAIYPIYAQSRYTTGFDVSSSSVNFVVSGTPVSLTWSGGNNGNTWDLINTPNWNSGLQEFYQFDQVTFDDSGNAASPVQLVGTNLYPSSVTFNANANNYTLAGGGAITGTAGVTLNGSATVTLLNTNSYTGGTMINAGILQVGDGATANGTLTGNVTNNAELELSPAFANPTASQIQIVPATIYGSSSGSIIVNGPGITRLSGANSGFGGFVEVQQGTLQAGSTTALGPYSVSTFAQVDSGATFDLNGSSTPNYFVVEGSGVGGPGAIIDSGAGCFMGTVALTGDTTFGGVTGWTIENTLGGGQGLIASGHNVTKVGANQIALSQAAASAWSPGWGSLNIQQGAFTLIGNFNLGTGNPITIYTNATLVLRTLPTVDLTCNYTLNDGAIISLPSTNSMIDGSVTLGGTGVFDIFASYRLMVNCPITGGTLIKGIGSHSTITGSTGAGTLILNNAVTTAGFVVQTGTVALTNNAIAATSASISATNIQLAGGTLSTVGIGGLTLNDGQSLTGYGTVVGAVTSPSGSGIAPAQTNGLITVNGSLTLAGTTTMDLNQNGSVVTNSQIVVTNILTCGGALVLTASGTALQAGATFKLFKAGTIVNPFTADSITYPTLDAGLAWTNMIAVNGTVAVISSQQPALSAAVTGSTLSISWPTNYSSYSLQVQTNFLSKGLGTNWTTLNVTATNNQINLPIGRTNGAVFLRLINPL